MAKGWYIVHTYSGYEQKIQRTILKLRESDADFALYCLDVKIPQEKYIENKDGVSKVKERKLLPGYILVEIDFPEDWKGVYSKIKRIQGVTSFVSQINGKKPSAMSAKEVKDIFSSTGDSPEEKVFKVKQNFDFGDEVKIIDGPFESFSGKIDGIDTLKGKLKVIVQIFGRPTSVEVDFLQVEKVIL